MPVQVDAPIAMGANDEWGLWGSAASKIAALATNDGDSSVVYAVSGGRVVTDDYQFPPLLGVADPVTAASLTAVTRMYSKGYGGRNYQIRWNSANTGVDRQAEVHVAYPNYLDITYSASGSGLAADAVNGEHGIRFTAAGGPAHAAEYWVTQLYRTVNFTYGVGSTGDFTLFIGSLVGALVGSGLMLREMPLLSGYMAREFGRWLREDEYEPAWRDWRAQKRMRMA
jgi:hypothetical protein